MREAALACFENAVALRSEAALLLEHSRPARAVALSIIAQEEFAKAIAYTAGALRPGQREIFADRLSALLVHEVKHLIVASAELAQIDAGHAIDGVEWTSDVPLTAEHRLAFRFAALVKSGLSELIRERKDARRLSRKHRSFERRIWTSVPEYVAQIDRKDAALYVDLKGGRVLVPDRIIHHAVEEISELDWCLEEYAALPGMLKDNAAWVRFTRWVRPQ